LLYFENDNSELWKTDGTPAGTSLVKTFPDRAGIHGGWASDGEKIYLSMHSNLTGRSSLWVSDGTQAGTVHVTDRASAPIEPVAVRPGLVFFQQRRPDSSFPTRYDLWKTDGTAAGTTLVAQLPSGTMENAVAYNGRLFFEALDVTSTRQLWKSDGTTAGTGVAIDPDPTITSNPDIEDVELMNGHLYYATRRAVWRTDGTQANTVRLTEATGEGAAPLGSNHILTTNGLVAVDGTLYFVASAPAREGRGGGAELYRTNPDGVTFTKLNDTQAGPSASIMHLIAAGDSLYLTAYDGTHGWELWRARPSEERPRVAGRHLFYNNSGFDRNGTAIATSADADAAAEKRPLLPGQSPSAANVSSYSKGINGVFIDFTGAPPGTLTPADFEFRVGTGGDPATWALAPAPLAVTRLPEWNGTTAARYAISWPDGAVRNQWLRVTVKANANTGLSAPDVFTFGSLVGETGDRTSPLRVTALDLRRTRAAMGSTTRSDSPFDHNRDGRVSPVDYALTRAAYGRALGAPSNPVVFAAPLIITRGGTYTGNWESLDPAVPAVTVDTAEPVVIENANVRGRGVLIKTTAEHARLTVRNTRGTALNPNVYGQTPGRFLESDEFDSVVVENNYLEGTGGIKLLDYLGDHTPADSVRVVGNVALNIDGRKSDGAGGYLEFNERTRRGDGLEEEGYKIRQFLQLDKVQGVPGVEIAWNRVVNEPGRSRVEDNINIYKSSGTPESPIRIHDNFIRGAYTVRPWQGGVTSDGTWDYDWGYAGGGILLGDSSSGESAHVEAYGNHVVSTSNYGIAIASGHDISFHHNRVVSGGYLPDGRWVAAQNVGAYIWDLYDTGPAAFYNNSGYDNLIGWVNEPDGSRNDWWVPDATSFRDNTRWSGAITRETEAAELSLWQQRAAAAGIPIGPVV
jgi:ELWxxDGT repeat protein